MNISTICVIVIIVAALGIYIRDAIDLRRKLKGFRDGTVWLTPDQFMRYMKKDTFTPGKTKTALSYNCDGAYVIQDSTTNTYYYGVSTKLFIQLQRLFMGHIDCPALIALQQQHDLKVSIIKFDTNKFKTMTELDDYAREKYNALSDKAPMYATALTESETEDDDSEE